MTPSAVDYSWVGQWLDGVDGAYCLTLVRGLTPAQFLERLHAQTEAPDSTATELPVASFETRQRSHGQAVVIGATTVHGADGDWVLGREDGSSLFVNPATIVPLSAATRVVSHRLVEAVDRFYWVEDGDIRLYFQPECPAWREGSTPDALVDDMRLAGFDLREDAEYNAEEDVTTEAAFALAEHLTGVRLTPEILDELVYLFGVAPVPQA